MPSYQAEPRFTDPGTDAVNDSKLPKMREDCVLLCELLDLEQERFALLGIELGCLLYEQCIDIWIAPVDIGTTLGDECLKTRGSVTESAAGSLDQVLKALLTVALIESCPLEWSKPGANSDCLKVVDHGLGKVGE